MLTLMLMSAMIERVNKVWKKPTLKKLIKWWKAFSDFNIHNYEYYLVGGIVLAVFYLVYIIYYDDFIDFFKF